VHVRPFDQPYLPQLVEFVNVHLAAVVPGWATTRSFLAETLENNHAEYVTDPWVAERATLCATEGHRVLAAAHLLRYGTGPEINDSFRGTGEIDWFLSLPGRDAAASAVLVAVRDLLATWEVRQERGWGGGVPAGPPLLGVPDSWPHVAAALGAAGYEIPAKSHREALYGGRLDGVPAPGEPPIAELEIQRTVGNNGTGFAAVLDHEELGRCEVRQDLTHGGALPALRGWAELSEIGVQESQRNRGIGGWLLRHAVSWLRLSGCDRLVLNVTEDDEAAGAGRFYRRFGWGVFAREIQLPDQQAPRRPLEDQACL
jgi:GNAT superfamily N-acetyltransferase